MDNREAERRRRKVFLQRLARLEDEELAQTIEEPQGVLQAVNPYSADIPLGTDPHIERSHGYSHMGPKGLSSSPNASLSICFQGAEGGFVTLDRELQHLEQPFRGIQVCNDPLRYDNWLRRWPHWLRILPEIDDQFLGVPVTRQKLACRLKRRQTNSLHSSYHGQRDARCLGRSAPWQRSRTLQNGIPSTNS